MAGVEKLTSNRRKRQLSSLYMTDMSRGATTVSDDILQGIAPDPSQLDDDQDPPRKYYEPHDIKIKLYLRECERLKVIPVSAYIRQPTKNTLKIRHYNIGPDGAKALAAALLLDTAIHYLDIEGNSITPVGLLSIQVALADNLFITYLNIAENRLGSEGAQLIGKLMTTNHCIEILNASRNGFRDSDSEVFAQIMRENRVLKELVLSGNEFEEMAGTEFGAALASNETLERLDLSWNHVRKQGAVDFAQGIKENVGLKRLNVSFNGFGTEGAASMSHALVTNRTLTELDMSKNRLVDIDMKIFTKHLHQNESLQILKIGDNPVTPIGAICVLKAVLASETTSLQHIDFGSTSVDKGFLSILAELQRIRDIKVTYGKVQNLYADKDMEPKIEKPPPPASETSEIMQGDEMDNTENIEKGKTYVVDKDGENVVEETSKDNDNSEEQPKDDGVEFNEKELDDEIEAVTGNPERDKQEAVYVERASVGTLTPDI